MYSDYITMHCDIKIGHTCIYTEETTFLLTFQHKQWIGSPVFQTLLFSIYK